MEKKQYIKKLIKVFFKDVQIQKTRMWFMKAIAFKRNIITKYPLASFGERNTDTFFGYYDLSPFNKNKVIYLAKKKEKHEAEIILRDQSDNSIKIIGITFAWNWQQGARLRWVPNHADRIMYNDFVDGRYISRSVDTATGEMEDLDWPLYDVDSNGEYGVTLDFGRLGVMRPGYGYINATYQKPETLSNEGIDLIDLKDKMSKRIITYNDIVPKLDVTSTDFQRCYINHLSFSPSGNKFLFFWIRVEENKIHHASLLVYDIKSAELTLLEKELSVSHYVWVDDQSIIVTAYNDNRECRYYLYATDGTRTTLLPDLLTQDGHPTWLGNGKMITDTYPDKHGYQRILEVDINTGNVNQLIDIYSTYKCFGEKRCDLHPRVNKENFEICFDANIKGNRSLYLLKGR